MLPPQTRTATFLPCRGNLRLRTAAMAAAPAPSARVFSRSSSRRMALAISSSSTVTMSSTYFWTRGRVCSPARRTAIPSAMVLADFSVTGLPSATAAFIDGNFRGLHAEHLHGWICFFDGAGNASDEASAADGSDDDFDARMLLQNFEAKSSLPGDHGVVVERVNQSEVVLCALRDCLFIGLVVVGAVQDDFCTVGACCRDFRERRGKRHDNARIDLVASGVIGDTLRMIAGGGRDHSVRAFFLIRVSNLFRAPRSLKAPVRCWLSSLRKMELLVRPENVSE